MDVDWVRAESELCGLRQDPDQTEHLTRENGPLARVGSGPTAAGGRTTTGLKMDESG